MIQIISSNHQIRQNEKKIDRIKEKKNPTRVNKHGRQNWAHTHTQIQKSARGQQYQAQKQRKNDTEKETARERLL